MRPATPARRLARVAALSAAALSLLVLLMGVLLWWSAMREEPYGTDSTDSTGSVAAADPALVERGAYLAKAGNCMACHTERGGMAFAGGRGIDTPFGTVYSSNLTPDRDTGLGAWRASDFWGALHHGRSKDGRWLYPAFPYTSYTQVSREDSDALFAYLQSLPPVRQPQPGNTLSWPFSTQAALAVWRTLYFKPGAFEPDPQQGAEWNRGAYLVRGLGHCAACHTARNALGGSGSLDLAGGLIPMQNWYAPSLTSDAEAGVGRWPIEHIASLLRTGVAPGASVQGPMAEVVLRSTQYLTEPDLQAMATFLKALPASAPDQQKARTAPPTKSSAQIAGARLYEQHCAQCHGEQGEGVALAYPALAGNRAVTLHSSVNLVQVVLHGGYPPATAGNPQPFGMPPYMLTLSDKDIASVLSFVRNAWGNQAADVTAVDVNRTRSGNAR
jgi:mono/diheme cytochrome c family protein